MFSRLFSVRTKVITLSTGKLALNGYDRLGSNFIRGYGDAAVRRSRFGRKLKEDLKKEAEKKVVEKVAGEKNAKKAEQFVQAQLYPSLLDTGSSGNNKESKVKISSRNPNDTKGHKAHHSNKERRALAKEAGENIAKEKAKKSKDKKNKVVAKPVKKESTKNSEKPTKQRAVKVKGKIQKRKRSPSHNKKMKAKLDIPTFLSVANLATILRVRVPALLNKLEEVGYENMTNDYILDGDTAGLIAEEYGYEVNQDDNLGADLFPSPAPKDPSKLKPRSPIVTIMGHVDHGKTTILDYFRKSSIAKGEQGGITQHIGAFIVKIHGSERSITFLDTPGHAAFLKMRQRGADMTDVVVLVVAADDSVMPQTIEAIKHTKNAGVPMIVAINKCDRPDANPDRVVADLSRHGVDVEDYGGEVPVVRISAKTGMGMKDLEETIVTVAELLELKAQDDKKIPVEGWILESQMKKGLGNCATFLVRKGKLKKGMCLVAGTTWCKVRVMKDENGKPLKLAGPSTPVEISGWKDIPEAGDLAIQSKDEAFAKKVVSNRERRKQQLTEADEVEDMNKRRVKQLKDAHRDEKIQEYQRDGFTMEEIKELDPTLFDSEESKQKIVSYIVKADVSGSSEAVRQSIEGLGNKEISAEVLYDEVGAPTESDIERAKFSNSKILVFNVKIPKDIASSCTAEGVEIKEFGVIYHLIEDVIKTLTDSLPQRYETKVISKALVKKLFTISLKKKEKMVIAGSKIVNGVFKRSATVQVLRNDEVIFKGQVKQLKIEKDDVVEVKKGAECGIALEGGPELKEGDTIETFEKIPIKKHL